MTAQDLRKQWGERIRGLREERGLSANKLAQMAEIHPSNLWKAEHGTAGLGDEARIRLASALGVQVAEVFAYPDTTRAAS